MGVQQLNKIGLISLKKLGTLENVADLVTKRVPRAVLDNLAGMMGYTFPDEETQKFQEYMSINKNYWEQKLAAIERLPTMLQHAHSKNQRTVFRITLGLEMLRC